MILRRRSRLENWGTTSRGLGSRFWFPHIALRSYFPVDAGLGAPVEEMTELTGEGTTELELEGTGAGLEGLGEPTTVSDGTG